MQWPLRQLVSDPAAASQSDVAHTLKQSVIRSEQIDAMPTQAGLVLLASSEPALERASSALLQQFPSLKLGKPAVNYIYGNPIMEPFARIALNVPEERVPRVLGDLRSRRAEAQAAVAVDGIARIEAEIPISELFGYETTLRMLCRSAIPFEQHFSGYKPAPYIDGSVA